MLNVTACSRLLEETPFRRLFVQPAANDAGNAIGAALYGYREVLGGSARPYLDTPYDTCLGRSYSPREIEQAIARGGAGLDVTRLDGYPAKVAALLPRLLDDRIVALFEGRSEFGPRALGHRSLVASPKDAAMRDRINRLKRREWYRPVAPAILEEALPTFFAAPFTAAPFMTLSARARAITAARAPAVVHVDGTARPQTVTLAQSPLLHHLLTAMGEAVGLPILVNTSFNVEGEPIVETPEDALRAFREAEDLGAVVIGDYLVERTP
jgi:carbamoyltransferase